MNNADPANPSQPPPGRGCAWWTCAGRPTAAILGFAVVVLAGTAIVVSADEREIICQPGYAASQRLHGEAYRRLRDAAFARAGVPVEKQCHHDNNAAGPNGNPGDPSQNQHDCLILDHIVPLCLGGTNTSDNLQLQRATEASYKDVREVKTCRAFCAGQLTLEQARDFFRSRSEQ